MLIGREVTVLGGGIAGLAVALATAQRGAQVRVYEQADAIREVGAGIQISPNGWRVLQALGVAEALAELSPRAERVRLRDFRRGAEVFTVPLTNPKTPYHFVHRADIVAVLETAAREAGVEIILSHEVSDVALGAAGVDVTFASGLELEAPCVLAADGLHSKARLALNPKSRPYFTGQVAWRCTVPAQADAPREAHVFMGPGRHLVRYPLRGGATTNIVAVEERDGWVAEDWHLQDDAANLRAAFYDFCPEVRDLLEQVEAPNIWGLFRHPVAQNWGQGGLALLGDAAHPTLPFMAQGANMALEDAYVLARCLAEDTDTDGAISRYQAMRQIRCMRIVDAAEGNAKNYHLPPGPYRFAAHSALRLAARFAPHAVTRRFDWIYDFDVTEAG